MDKISKLVIELERLLENGQWSALSDVQKTEKLLPVYNAVSDHLNVDDEVTVPRSQFEAVTNNLLFKIDKCNQADLVKELRRRKKLREKTDELNNYKYFHFIVKQKNNDVTVRIEKDVWQKAVKLRTNQETLLDVWFLVIAPMIIPCTVADAVSTMLYHFKQNKVRLSEQKAKTSWKNKKATYDNDRRKRYKLRKKYGLSNTNAIKIKERPKHWNVSDKSKAGNMRSKVERETRQAAKAEILGVTSVIPTMTASGVADMYTINKAMNKQSRSARGSLFPTRSKYKAMQEELYESKDNDILLESMGDTEVRRIQKRADLIRHESLLTSSMTYEKFENTERDIFDAECVCSISNIPLGPGQGCFQNEVQFIECVVRILRQNHIITKNVHPQFRSLVSLISGPDIIEEGVGVARIGFENFEDCEEAIKILRKYYDELNWRVCSIMNPCFSTKISCSDTETSVKVLIMDMSDEKINKVINYLEEKNYNFEENEMMLSMLLWLDKGQNKTAIRFLFVDEHGFWYDDFLSDIATITEYVGGEEKFDAMVGPEVMDVINKIELMTFRNLKHKKLAFRLKVKWVLVDHSAGYMCYGLKGGTSNHRVNFGNAPLDEFTERYDSYRELHFTVQDIEDSYNKRHKAEEAFLNFKGNRKEKNKRFGTARKDEFFKTLDKTMKAHKNSNMFTRNGYKGDISDIKLCIPPMHDVTHLNKHVLDVNLNHVAHKAKIKEIGKIASIYRTAMANKATYITTSATDIRKAARYLTTHAPKQIKQCKDIQTKAYFAIPILNRIVDTIIYLYRDISAPESRLLYRVSIRVLALFLEDISKAKGGKSSKQGRTKKKQKKKYKSTNENTYLFDLVTFLPEFMDRNPTVPIYLLTEDAFEQTFFHDAHMNILTRTNINLGSRNSRIQNKRKYYNRLKRRKSMPSGWINNKEFVAPDIILCKKCVNSIEHWKVNISDMMNTIKHRKEFENLFEEKEKVIHFAVGEFSDYSIMICPSGKHVS
eukprot:490001_1